MPCVSVLGLRDMLSVRSSLFDSWEEINAHLPDLNQSNLSAYNLGQALDNAEGKPSFFSKMFFLEN